jgi:peptide/nickel transport system substrate-binding protein
MSCRIAPAGLPVMRTGRRGRTLSSNGCGRKAVIVLVVFVMLLAACGSGDDNEGEASTDGAADTGGELVFVDDFAVESFTPELNSSGRAGKWLQPVYDQLVNTTPDGEVIPGLAEEWAVEEDAIELVIRQGVTFHDGTPLDAEAVKANFDHHASLVGVQPLVNEFAEFIDAVEILDTHRVRIQLTEPVATGFFFSLAGGSMMTHMVSPPSLGSDDLSTNPVGAGPFKVTEFVPGDRAVFERNADYWDPDEATLDRMVFMGVEDAATRLTLLRAGDAHVGIIDTAAIPQVTEENLQVEQFPGGRVLTLNTYYTADDALMTNRDFRRAINHAIDREALVQALGEGAGVPTLQVFSPDNPYYNEDYPADYYEHDPERAVDLIEQSGVELRPLEVIILARPEEVRVGELLQSQLADAGIELQLRVVPPERFDLFTIDLCCPFFMGNRRYDLEPMTQIRFTFGPQSEAHPGGVGPEGLEDLLEQASPLAPDDPQRAELAREGSGLTVEDPTAFPLFVRNLAYVVDDCVSGFEPYVSGIDQFGGVTSSC